MNTTIQEDLEMLTLTMSGSIAPSFRRRKSRFSFLRWLRLFPFDRLVFRRIDNDEYFEGLQKHMTSLMEQAKVIEERNPDMKWFIDSSKLPKVLAQRFKECMGEIELHIGEYEETQEFREIVHRRDVP